MEQLPLAHEICHNVSPISKYDRRYNIKLMFLLSCLEGCRSPHPQESPGIPRNSTLKRNSRKLPSRSPHCAGGPDSSFCRLLLGDRAGTVCYRWSAWGLDSSSDARIHDGERPGHTVFSACSGSASTVRLGGSSRHIFVERAACISDLLRMFNISVFSS